MGLPAGYLVPGVKGGTGQNTDWEARLHGGRTYWNQQNGEHMVREICLGQSLQFSSL